MWETVNEIYRFAAVLNVGNKSLYKDFVSLKKVPWIDLVITVLNNSKLEMTFLKL